MTSSRSTGKIGAAILAGGKATRMGGVAKGRIEAASGVAIVQRSIRQFDLAGVDDVIIVSSDAAAYQEYGRPVIPDVRPGMGPLGGIEAALRYFAGRCDTDVHNLQCASKVYDAVIFVPCDLPRINAGELRKLLDAFDPAADRVVYARTGVFFDHPLCSVVHNALLPEIEAAIDRGDRAVGKLWRSVGGRAVCFEDDTAFVNLNTLEDLNAWQSRQKTSQ